MSGDARISRQEVAAVAVALLLPIPLLVASGLRFPLSGAIERGAASLTPGGGFDGAVVEAAPARTDTAPVVPSRGAPVGSVSAVGTPLTSSAVLPPSADASSIEREKPDETTPGEADSPSLPEPHTDGETPAPSAEDDGDPGVDISTNVSEPLAAAAAAESVVEIEAEAADASVEITVTDTGVAVDTGGAADVGPPLEVPLELPATTPTLPLP
jgi:hypothetical protein